MTEESKPAYLLVCGTATGQPVDPEYVKLATPVAEEFGLKPIAGGAVGAQVEVLEGQLPAGTNFLVIEEFPSMDALRAFYESDAYQRAIPHRASAFDVQYLAAVDGLSAADLQARAEAAKELLQES